MSRLRSHQLSPADLEAIEDIKRALVALALAFERLSSEGHRSLHHSFGAGFEPFANGAFQVYFERLDSAQ